ncbi:hypothetical protein AB9M91_03285 [Bacillus safensis]|uniref:hypothetical protein n=1 Tax=Bacillus safensis TaxID=561879 RepID=UPI00351653BB
MKEDKLIKEINENNTSIELTTQSKICPAIKEEAIKYAFNKQDIKNFERSKVWNLGRFDVGDCEIRKTDITILENGHFNIVFELHDHGTLFGDKYDIDINLWGPPPYDELIMTWKFYRELGAGDDQTNKIESVDPSPTIKNNFNRIEGANRILGCKPQY